MKAFTIVEMMVSLAIFTVLMLALCQLFLTGVTIHTQDTALLEAQQDARNGMEWIVREVRESKASTITVVDANSDRLSFNTPNESGILYYRNGNTLIREFPAGTMRDKARMVNRLKFTKNSQFLTIDLQSQQVVRGRTYSFPLRENVRLRNE